MHTTHDVREENDLHDISADMSQKSMNLSLTHKNSQIKDPKFE